VFAHGETAALVDGPAWIQAMLDFEAALARACAQAGLIPTEAAEQIAGACRVELFDVAAIGRAAAGPGNPAGPLVSALRAVLPPEVAGHVHLSATSQDVIDTAAMLLARRAAVPILADAALAARACARLADEHRQTVMLGRTLLQPAVPITFGLKAAGWLAGISRARAALERALAEESALQFGGAAGTLASLGAAAAGVEAALGRELGLPLAPLPWHTERTRIAAIAAALATLAGSLAKVARDLTLLSQGEVAEVALATAGGSSAMPHKRNPVAAIAVLACAARTGPLAATITAALVQEHERAAGAWHSEWEPWAELLRLTGSATAWSAEMLDGLQVEVARMRTNLLAAGDEVMTESVVSMLTKRVGPGRARELVDEAVARSDQDGTPIATELADLTAGVLDAAELERALSPESYVGAAGTFIDRALAQYGEG
jgi:3-carboxy-cis,cis-muconate cycloisomerase